MPPPLQIDQRLQRMGRQIVRARALYDLWWLCAGKETREPYGEAFERYSELFKFLEHGLLIAAVVQALIPFDKRSDTLSIRQAIKVVGRSGGLSAAEAVDLSDRLEAVKVASMRMVRNNAFAHYSHALNYNEVFTKAGLRPMDIGVAIDEAMAIINVLLASQGLEPVERNEFPAQDGRMLLENIVSDGRS